MTEYSYRNFKIRYDVELNKNNLYTADGYIVCALDKHKTPNNSQKFHTEHHTESGARDAIKKMIEDYIDFEWEEFEAVHGEKDS